MLAMAERRAGGEMRLRECEHALQHRAQERGGRPLAGDVAERKPEGAGSPVRGSRRSRRQSIGTEYRGGGLEVREGHVWRRQQRLLNLRGDAQFLSTRAFSESLSR